MKALLVDRKCFMFILVILLIGFGTQGSYAQTITASTPQPLTERTLHESIVTLTLNGAKYERSFFDIEDAVSVSGIEGVSIQSFFGVDRVSDTEITVELEFAGNIDTDATLTFTIDAWAIAGYNRQALTAQIPVTAIEESLEASTVAPLTESTLHGSIATLTLSGRQFADEWDIEGALSVSGVEGVIVGGWDPERGKANVERVNDREVTIRLKFFGNIDEDTILTLIVGPDAIVGGYDKDFTFQFPVTAVEESLVVTTEVPLREATLDGNTITLTLTGRRFRDRSSIRDALSVSGIDGVILDTSRLGLKHISDTVITVELEFAGNIDTDATLTLTVGANAIGFDKDFTFQFPITAVEESFVATTEAPLTEATLHGGIITITLNGRRFHDRRSIRDALSFSGIEGVFINRFDVRPVSDTEATVELSFSGNIDEDATLTLTVGAGAIAYNKDFTFEFHVTAVEESLVISTFPLTEATLNGGIITLTLTGRRFIYGLLQIRNALSVSGIKGVTVNWRNIQRVSDTEVKVRLTFSGNMDTDGTLTFAVGADAIAGYEQGATTQFSVTAIQKSDATVSISPSPVVSPNVGEQLTLNLNIAGGENIAGYQATVRYDRTALRLMDSTDGNYLPADGFFLTDKEYRQVKLTATTLAGAGNGDGTLATLTFDVIDFKASALTLSNVYLVDTTGKRWETDIENGEITEPPELAKPILGDLNRDGVVNIQDLRIVNARFGQRGQNRADINGDGVVNIADLVLVASAFNDGAAAPPLNPQVLELLTADDVQGWLFQARQLALTDPTYLRGITVLEQLLKALTPKQTALLPNYPNPFNPETWIPYHLSNDVNVHISIYNMQGVLVRQLDLGHQMAGYYTDRTKAAYWDGKNGFGEQVASGVYFYHLFAGDYSATRKMLILK